MAGNGMNLSNREKEVASLIAEGFDNQLIAKRLFIGIKTVEHHIHSISNFMKSTRNMDGKNLRVSIASMFFNNNPHNNYYDTRLFSMLTNLITIINEILTLIEQRRENDTKEGEPCQTK